MNEEKIYCKYCLTKLAEQDGTFYDQQTGFFSKKYKCRACNESWVGGGYFFNKLNG